MEEKSRNQRLEHTEEAEKIESGRLKARREFVAEAKKRLMMEEEEGFGLLKGALLISEIHAENQRLLSEQRLKARLESVRNEEECRKDIQTWRQYEKTLQERSVQWTPLIAQ